MAQTILVTGGTGYIGGEVIDQLLAKGHTVHTTVRNAGKSEPRLRARWPDAGGRLKVFQADLMDDAGWAQANAGCDAVAHIASPFPLTVPKDPEELIKPAREGTIRALRFAAQAGIPRFVQTSSTAAIVYGHEPGRETFDEGDWTDTSDPRVAAYPKSKTLAEKAARNWVADNAPDMAFCSVNPIAVLGPVESGDLSTSIEFVRKAIDGSMPMIPNIGVGVVDVRDVAALHVLALEAPADTVRNQRFPAAGPFMWMHDIAQVLRTTLPSEETRRIPRRKMPDFLVPILSLFMPEMKQLRNEIGRVRRVDSGHSERVLGWTMRPVNQTIEETARSLIDRGIVKF